VAKALGGFSKVFASARHGSKYVFVTRDTLTEPVQLLP
jgi:hypothetical protein